MPSDRLTTSFRKTLRTFILLLPIITGMLLLTSLVAIALPGHITAELFGASQWQDALLGTAVGSIAMGHPLASYLLGGELLKGGVSLVTVTAFIVSWVTVGVVQLPAESLMFGWRFALYRNLLCFFSAIAIAFLCVQTLRLLG
jgi:uncharacterized membrane protein YraQ (UPF0718 family)